MDVCKGCRATCSHAGNLKRCHFLSLVNVGLLMRSWKVVASLLGFGFIILYYRSMTDPLYGAQAQIASAMEDLDTLKSQNEELKKLATEVKDIKIASSAGFGKGGAVKDIQKRLDKSSETIVKMSIKLGIYEAENTADKSSAPSNTYENTRRKVFRDAQEFWLYMRSSLQKAKTMVSSSSQVASKLNDMLSVGAGYDNTLFKDINKLAIDDGYDEWRKAEAESLGKLVQDWIRKIQNPKDCKSAKKLVCKLSWACGYGCTLHHVAFCFILALSTNRTFVLESKGWEYATDGWEAMFLPLSDTCHDRSGSASQMWSVTSSNNMDSVQVVEVPIESLLRPRSNHLPLAVPSNLAPRLTRIHGDPSVWWIGQFIKYLCRPVAKLQKDIDATREALKFQRPIVGVQVRRTDKIGVEADFYAIEKYMEFVEEYYDKLQRTQTVEKRRVYLASDDPAVLSDARQKFPSYEFVSDAAISTSADLGTRFSDSSLRGIILDIHFLSMSDYLVCTFSSNVCRAAYELMQTMHVDASSYFHTLDDTFFFHGQNNFNRKAVEKHDPKHKEEIEIEPGDLIGVSVDGNKWNGVSEGRNLRTGHVGLYPSYKVINKVKTAYFSRLEVAKRR